MAHTAQSLDEIPRTRRSRAKLSRIGWTLFGVVLLALTSYGFVRTRGSSLRASGTEVELVGTPGPVRTYGSIPNLLNGNMGEKVSLNSLPSGPGIVAIGSLSDLRGEIAIVRGVTWLSYPAPGGQIAIERNPSRHEGAGFLAIADVPRWQSQGFEERVPFDRLVNVIRDRARRAGIDTSRPFPLVIDGTFSAIELNVVNGPALGSEEPTRERMNATAVKATVPSGSGSIVGFFGARGGERLVHAGESVHLHIVLPDAQKVGHLDSAQVEPGSSLHLPAAP